MSRVDFSVECVIGDVRCAMCDVRAFSFFSTDSVMDGMCESGRRTAAVQKLRHSGCASDTSLAAGGTRDFEQEYAAPKELLHVAAGCYKYPAPLALWVCHATGDSRALGGNQSVANDRDLEDVLPPCFSRAERLEGNTGDVLGGFSSAILNR